MVTQKVVNDINSLKPDEQILVFSLVNSLKKRNEKKTEAQIHFAEECRKYEDRDMSMEEIDQIIHEEA